MRIFIFSLLLCSTAAFAQDYSAAPMVVVGDETAKPAAPAQAEIDPMLADFPAWAITQMGAATGGQTTDAPPAPESAPAPAAAPAAPTPVAEATPKPPASPVSKLWPKDTVPIFVRSCVGIQPLLVAPCTCVITRLMMDMPHDEFLGLTAAGTIEQDARLIDARKQCIGTPQKRPE